MRRLVAGLIAFLALTAVVLVLPVYSSPGPAPRPVETRTEAVALGSVTVPAATAAVDEGTSQPVDGVPASAPVLRVTRTDVPEFSLVGVTWAADPGVTDTVVLVRVQDDAGDWGDWTEIGTELADQDAGTDSGAEVRGGTAPLWTGPSTSLEVEVVTRTGTQPTDVQLDLIDPGASEADDSLETPAIQDTADAAMAMPATYSRAQWGADESIRTWGPEYAPTIKAATVHHTADSNNYTADQVPSIMRSIYRYQAVSLGWGDIGYNVIVDKFGRLWEGRAGGLASTVIGAHAGGFNTSTFGVSMLGNYDTAETTPALINSVSAIIAWKFALYGVNPQGATSLTSAGGGTAKYAPGTRVTLPTIFGHRDVGNTVCPGRYAYGRLGEIRTKAAGTIGEYRSPIETYYEGDPSVQAALGTPVGEEQLTPAGDGLYRHYQRGSIYWSATTGARMTSGAIRNLWMAMNGEGGPLGYPTSEVRCGLARDGCDQFFEGGLVVWSPATGTRMTNGAIGQAWMAAGRESGVLGYPSTDMGCGMVQSGCGQQFEGGSVYWTPVTGAHAVSGPIRDYWMAQGWERGTLGYASSDVVCVLEGASCRQDFQGETVTWSSGGGVQTTSGAIGDVWVAGGAGAGPLGEPTAAMVCGLAGGGCKQEFAGGTVYASGVGVHAVAEPIASAWAARGAEGGALGYPSAAMVCAADASSCRQDFQGQTLTWGSTAGAQTTSGAIRGVWMAAGAGEGSLGSPTADMVCGLAAGGCKQEFEDGAVYASAATGTRVVSGPVEAAWEAAGAESGPLGYPATDQGCGMVRGGCGQQFERGSVYWSPGSGAHPTSGAIRNLWMAMGWERGPLGYATTDIRCGLAQDGCDQTFEGGIVTWSTATGTRMTNGAIGARWVAEGRESGYLGYPSTDMGCGMVRSGCGQQFQYGSIYWSPGTGAQATSGAIRNYWASQGWERGALGFPAGAMTCAEPDGGCRQRFEGGTLLYSPVTGRVTKSG